ncbi:hypothetical protein ACWEQ2_39945 [Streptomyces sp. NPDC004096]
MATLKAGGGQWGVPEIEVRRATAELNVVEMDRGDLVRIGPFGGAPKQKQNDKAPLRWRQRITWELQELGGPERATPSEGRLHHLAGIDWRRVLVEETRDRTVRAWWLPRAVVRLLDAAEHAETRWRQAARTRQNSTAAAEPPSQRRQIRAAGGRQTTSPHSSTTAPRQYNGELKELLYSALSRKPGISRKVAEWMCAVCRTTPATVLDHCHEHGYVRAPFSELLPLPSAFGTDPVLGQPPEQLLARGLGKTPSCETGVVGDLCHAFGGWHECLDLLVSGELGFRKHQPLKTAVEDIDTQGRHAETRLGQLHGWQRGEHVVLGWRQVRIRDQAPGGAGQ